MSVYWAQFRLLWYRDEGLETKVEPMGPREEIQLIGQGGEKEPN